METDNKLEIRKANKFSLKAYLFRELNWDNAVEETMTGPDYRKTTYNLLTIPVRLEKVYKLFF